MDYLVSGLDVPESMGKIIEVGGANVLTYGQMMLGYTRARGLRRWLISVPVLTPRLSSYWVHWITPIPSTIVRPLVEGLRNEVIVRESIAKTIFPKIVPMDYSVAVDRTLKDLELG